MDGYFNVLALVLLPAGGNFAGGLLAEFVDVSRRMLSLALHAAAGIVLAVVGVELMPRVLEANPPWVSLLALVGGSVFAVLVDEGTDVVQARTDSAAYAGPIAIYFGAAIDPVTDEIAWQ